MARASATETVDSGLIPSQVEPKTQKINSFSIAKDSIEPVPLVDKWKVDSKTAEVLSPYSVRGKLVNNCNYDFQLNNCNISVE